MAEYALNNINHPMGITEYELTKIFPEEFKSSLPTIEEIENELNNERYFQIYQHEINFPEPQKN